MVMTQSAMTQSSLCTVCTGHEHRPSIQRSEERWEHRGTHTALPCKGQRRGGNTVVHTRRTSIHRSEERWETVVQAHRCDSSLVEPFPT